jgi:hypothetical protein
MIQVTARDERLVGQQQKDSVSHARDPLHAGAYRCADAVTIGIVHGNEARKRATGCDDLTPLMSDHQQAAFAAGVFREPDCGAHESRAAPRLQLLGGTEAARSPGRENDGEKLRGRHLEGCTECDRRIMQQ